MTGAPERLVSPPTGYLKRPLEGVFFCAKIPDITSVLDVLGLEKCAACRGLLDFCNRQISR